MRETGKININDIEELALSKKRRVADSLSIRYTPNGLSFYRHDIKEMVTIAVNGAEDAAALLASHNGDLFTQTNFIVATDRYVAVPNELYDETYDNEYLFAKGLRCGDDETIVRTSSCDITFLTLVNAALLKSARLTAVDSDVANSLQYLLEAGRCMASKTRKGVLYIAYSNNVLDYAYFRKGVLQSFDSVSGCDFAKTLALASQLNDTYGIDKVVAFLDDKELLPLAFKRHSKRIAKSPAQDYFEQKYK